MNEKRITYYSHLSDKDIVKLLLANDAEAIEYVFFCRCENLFSHISNTVVCTLNSKDELVNEFFLYLSSDDWRRLRQFQFKSSIDTWLTIVAIRFFKSKEEPELPKTVELNEQDLCAVKKKADDFDIIYELSRVELYEAIEKLKNSRERCALLGVLAGKSADKVAGEMGCSVMAVYNLIKKAKKALKKIMKGKWE